MANLAEGIQGMVQHMRKEQQMVRDWMEAQSAQQQALQDTLKRLASATERNVTPLKRVGEPEDDWRAKSLSRNPPRDLKAAERWRWRAHRRLSTRIDYWPGFVDALATLLLVFVFLLSVFILAQFFLGQEVTSKDTVLTRLNAQIAELTELLSLEKSESRDLQETLADAAVQSRAPRKASATGCRGCSTRKARPRATRPGAIATLEGELADARSRSASGRWRRSSF